jgi:hypothetical protein
MIKTRSRGIGTADFVLILSEASSLIWQDSAPGSQQATAHAHVRFSDTGGVVDAVQLQSITTVVSTDMYTLPSTCMMLLPF